MAVTYDKVYDWLHQYAAQLVMWVKVDLVVMSVGFVILAVFAAKNEMELTEKVELLGT